jgi:hypothetical protein
VYELFFFFFILKFRTTFTTFTLSKKINKIKGLRVNIGHNQRSPNVHRHTPNVHPKNGIGERCLLLMNVGCTLWGTTFTNNLLFIKTFLQRVNVVNVVPNFFLYFFKKNFSVSLLTSIKETIKPRIAKKVLLRGHNYGTWRRGTSLVLAFFLPRFVSV